MIVGSIPRRYARALFQLAIEQGKVEPWAEALAAMQRVVGSSGELQDVLVNPVYATAQRRAIAVSLSSLLDLDREPANLVALLADRNRLGYLPGIVDAFAALADAHLGRVRARVTSAVALEERAAAELAARLGRAARAQVILDRVVDPDLLGGVVAQVGPLTYDGSIRSQLEALRRSLEP